MVLIFDSEALDRLRERATNVLLRAPADPYGKGDEWWETSKAILSPGLDRGLEASSIVAGVATGYRNGEPMMLVFTAVDVPIDAALVAEILGSPYPVEVLVTGEVVPAARPCQGGDSLSGACVGGDTGTLGCLVEDDAGSSFVLGCNHTLAGVNQATRHVDQVWQPGAGDGGTVADLLGTLADFEPINLGGVTPNVMDAAVALVDPNDVDPGVRSIGAINGFRPLSYGERVCKVGWKTGYTAGANVLTSSYQTTFPGAGRALFVNQHTIQGDLVSGFADQGDSGAAVLTEDGNEMVGIVVGVLQGPNLAFVSPVSPIMARFQVVPA